MQQQRHWDSDCRLQETQTRRGGRLLAWGLQVWARRAALSDYIFRLPVNRWHASATIMLFWRMLSALCTLSVRVMAVL
jgi:hypothetical protein